MSEQQIPFDVLISRVREGSQEAAWDLISQYGPYVLRVVRRRLPQDLRKKFDSVDFTQAAWASVFRHRSRLIRFSEPDEFVAFLAAVAANKVRMEIRRFQGKKYAIHREESLEDGDGLSAPAAHDPRPSQIAVARERWFELLKDQPLHYQRVIKMRYLGAKTREIAETLGLDESTVRRVLRRIFQDTQ